MLLSNCGAEQVAARAEQLFEQLLHHFARLVGTIGTMTLFKRAVVLASAQLPSLGAAGAAELPQIVPALRAALDRQDPTAIIEAFAGVLAAFTRLLEKLIGTPLVRQLLQESWPQAFPTEKESS